MTTIAWDGKTLAGDKRTSFGGLHAVTTKVARIGNLLVGCAGNAAQIAEMHEWVKNGRVSADLPKPQLSSTECVSMLVIEPSGQVLHYESTAYPIQIENMFWAIGSGRDFAMAAMHLGLSAFDAVEVASVFETGTGNGIDTLTLEGNE